MNLRRISQEIYTHAIKQESMKKQLTEANLKIYRYEKALKEIAEESGTPYAEIALKALKEK